MKTRQSIKSFIIFIMISFLIIGEIRCIVNIFKCNWNPIGKAEIIYTVSTFTGIGSIVGWIDIEDK